MKIQLILREKKINNNLKILNNLNKLKIAITGASGWVGKNLLDSLSKKN